MNRSGFPGGPSFVWEAADADLVADVMVWAAQSPQAANEALGITNGDVFEWRNVWPAMAKILGVETGPDMPTGVAAYLKQNADLWAGSSQSTDFVRGACVSLSARETSMRTSHSLTVPWEGPRAFVSTVKLRQARGSQRQSIPRTPSARH